jgi:hypothetical protein
MADEAKKPKDDQDDDYGPEHRYAFLLAWVKHHIPTESRETIKQKLDNQHGDEPRFGYQVTIPARSMN